MTTTYSSPNNEDVKRFEFYRIDLVATFQLACLKAGLETGYVMHPMSFSRISRLEYHENGIEDSELEAFKDAYQNKGGGDKWLDLFKMNCIKANITNKQDDSRIKERIKEIETFEVPLYKTALDTKYYVAHKETATEPSPSEKQYDSFMDAYVDRGGDRKKIPPIQEACDRIFREKFDPAEALDYCKELYRETWINWYDKIPW